MKADDLRLQFLHQGAHRFIEGSAIGYVDRRIRVDPELLIIRRQALLPSGLALGISRDCLVAEKIHVHGCRNTLADDVDLLARLFSRQHRARQRSQRTALSRGDDKFRIHDTRHRCLHDRKFSLEKLQDSAVWPHDLLLMMLGSRRRLRCRETPPTIAPRAATSYAMR